MWYEKEIYFEVEKDNDNPIQIWVPTPKLVECTAKVISFKPRFGLERFGNKEIVVAESEYSHIIDTSEDNIFTMHYFCFPSPNKSKKLSLTFDFTPQPTIKLERDDYFTHLGLVHDDLVDFRHELIPELSAKIEKWGANTGLSYVDSCVLYLSRFLQYESEPSSRVASEVLKSQKSDCGGYHALLCALLRYKNIPSLLAFGFWGNMDEVYHTTAYVKIDGEWVQKDINDAQDNQGRLTPFVPISIGINPLIQTSTTPNFPTPVRFIQHSLLWIEGSKPTKVTKAFRLISK